ncbi:hypothetical protein ACFQZJ_12095 [Maribacter chungangensis]|uniref:O-antigen ligase family protein n=1 Tax=Maribacter chungangensis TaxID=1069117 RepID=A0ABW3B565_9FLAO
MQSFIIVRSVFFLSVFLTLISQVPQVLEMQISVYLQSSWLVTLVLLIVNRSIFIGEAVTFIALLFIFLIIYALLMQIVSGNDYFESAHIGNIAKSLLIFIIAYNSAPYFTDTDFAKWLGRIGLIGGTILAISIYWASFATEFDVKDITYAYKAKNSASQILLSCQIFVLLLFQSKVKVTRLFKVVFLLFTLYLILMLKSRATILGLIFVIILTYRYTSNKIIKKLTLVFTLISGSIVLFFEDIRNILIENILFGGRDINDLNEVSSGRVEFLYEFPELFSENIWFGRGYYFIDSFPLSILLGFGAIGSLFIFIFLLLPILFLRKRLRFYNPLHLVFLLLVVTYYFNGLFEEQSPFGPGSKNFLLWLILGYLFRVCQRRPRLAEI